MAAPRRKKTAKKPAKARKAAGTPKAKTGLLSSLAQYVRKKASGLVKRRKKRAKRRAAKAKAAAPT